MGCVSSMSAPSDCSCGTLERIFCHIGLHTWDEDSMLHAHGRISQTDEHLNYGTTSTAGTS
jgi:hypothetical protein